MDENSSWEVLNMISRSELDLRIQLSTLSTRLFARDLHLKSLLISASSEKLNLWKKSRNSPKSNWALRLLGETKSSSWRSSTHRKNKDQQQNGEKKKKAGRKRIILISEGLILWLNEGGQNTAHKFHVQVLWIIHITNGTAGLHKSRTGHPPQTLQVELQTIRDIFLEEGFLWRAAPTEISLKILKQQLLRTQTLSPTSVPGKFSGAANLNHQLNACSQTSSSARRKHLQKHNVSLGPFLSSKTWVPKVEGGCNKVWQVTAKVETQTQYSLCFFFTAHTTYKQTKTFCTQLLYHCDCQVNEEFLRHCLLRKGKWKRTRIYGAKTMVPLVCSCANHRCPSIKTISWLQSQCQAAWKGMWWFEDSFCKVTICTTGLTSEDVSYRENGFDEFPDSRVSDLNLKEFFEMKKSV